MCYESFNHAQLCEYAIICKNISDLPSINFINTISVALINNYDSENKMCQIINVKMLFTTCLYLRVSPSGIGTIAQR